MPKKKTPLEIKIIYFIVPETVTVPLARGKKRIVRMEAGRLAMQAVHVALGMYERVLALPRKAKGYGEITAIMLSVRNSRELEKIEKELRDLARSFEIPPFDVHTFSDRNPEFYGTKKRIATAICTTPIEKSVVDPVLGHLNLYKDQMQALIENLRR